MLGDSVRMNFDFSNEIFSDSPEAIYLQLLNIIQKQIEDGRLVPGDMLPSEMEFCNAYHISRTTVRQALRELELTGAIERKRGLGTYISSPKLSRNIGNLYSFTDEMCKLGKVPSSNIIDFKLVEKDNCPSTAREIDSSRLIDVVRIRLADGCPMLIENTFLPVSLCPNLSWEMLETDSLYTILSKKYGLNIAKAIETYEAIVMTKEESQLLECNAGDPAFLIKRITWDDQGRMIEYTKSITASARSKLEITMYPNSVQAERITV